MSQQLPKSNVSKAVSFTGAAAGVWLKAVAHRNGHSQRLRNEIKNISFRSRAAIREESLAEFCGRFAAAGTTRPEALNVPLTCLENSLGGSAYYLTLAAIAAVRQPRQIVEFGTFLGHSALIFAMNVPDARILTFDLPDEVDDLSNLNETDQSHVRSSRERVGQVYRGTTFARRITEFKCDSRTLRLAGTIEWAELVFIDGGHDLSCISADTENALSVAPPGAVILWDDYFWLYPDVVEYLERLAQRLELVRIADTNLVGYVCE
jgi:predicted O-methyltransferase YrrM